MNEMEKIDELFKRLEGEFDIEEPKTGHQDRFLQKLNRNNSVSAEKTKGKLISWWKPLSIAASVIFLALLGTTFVTNLKNNEVVEVPIEIEKAQFYFTSLINTEIEKINAEATPDNKQVIEDAMAQIKKLEKDYQDLEKKLLDNGNTKQLLHAMITNFQTRVSLLENVLEQIENIKHLKKIEYENIAI